MNTINLHDLGASGAGCGFTEIISDTVKLSVEYEYFDEDSGCAETVGEIIFDGVAAYRFHGEYYGSGRPTTGDDTIVEILDSSWISEMNSHYPDGFPKADLHHFAVFLSNNGFLEVAAGSVSLETPRRGNLRSS